MIYYALIFTVLFGITYLLGGIHAVIAGWSIVSAFGIIGIVSYLIVNNVTNYISKVTESLPKAAYKEPGVLKTWYKSFKEKTCIIMEIKG